MSLPRFDFAPHEWPPLAQGEREGLADAVFWVEWNGEEVEVVARWVDVSRCLILFFRCPQQSPLTWVVGSHDYIPSEFGLPDGDASPIEAATSAQRHVKEAKEASSFGHTQNFDCSPFGVSGSRWLYLSINGQGGSWNGPGFPHDASVFHLQKSFEQEVDDPESDVRFALRWSHLSLDERISKATHFRNGDLNELSQVVRAVGISEAARQNPLGSWEIYFPDAWHSWTNAQVTLKFEGKNPRLRRWWHHLNRYFGPHKDEALAAQHLCLQKFSVGIYAEFEEDPSSQHERLEAALFLRDWARDKIPPDELRLLLPKL